MSPLYSFLPTPTFAQKGLRSRGKGDGLGGGGLGEGGGTLPWKGDNSENNLPRTPLGFGSQRPWGHQHWVCTSLGRSAPLPHPSYRTEGCGGFRERGIIVYIWAPPRAQSRAARHTGVAQLPAHRLCHAVAPRHSHRVVAGNPRRHSDHGSRCTIY